MPVFSDYPQFTPNLTPKQMFQSGIFGGTYFGSIHSQVTWKEYTDAHKEFPTDRFAWVVVTDTTYDRKKNKYLVKCSTPLQYREQKWWIHPQDPYGRVQWYCRFYLGRRTPDDDRQIKRRQWVAWPKGRFKTRLISLIQASYATFNDPVISPKIRQLLLHWACEITADDVYRD